MLKWSLFCICSCVIISLWVNLFHLVPAKSEHNISFNIDVWTGVLPFSQLVLEQIQLIINVPFFFKVKMGLLVDLTNTSRFYDRNDIEKEGIKYIKLQCKGHGECPTTENTETFIRLCERFNERNPPELIGTFDLTFTLQLGFHSLFCTWVHEFIFIIIFK